jgi:DNA-binding transcriptional LysR family regulator
MVRVQTRNLETLLYVVRLGGVSAAARHLNLTQPTVSRRIDELERELGRPLFQREGRGMVPTPLARQLLAHAERVLAELDAMRDFARGRVPLRPAIRIGVVEFVALTWFERVLTRLREAFPQQLVDLHVNVAASLVDGLTRRQLDIIMLPGPVRVAGVVKHDIGAIEMRWIATPAHMRSRDFLTPRDLAEMPVMLATRGSASHQIAMRWFEAEGVVPARLSLCNNLSVVGTLIRKGLGVAPLPVELYVEDIAAGSLFAVPGRPAMQPLEYSACYLPSAEIGLMREIARFAQEESWLPPLVSAGLDTS